MAITRSAATGGLSTSDIEGIRTSLAGGRKPKVMFTEAAGQIAGQVGQVVQLTDPANSDEWLVVRFGQDELPFSPTDLAMPPKAVRGGSKQAGKRAEPARSARPVKQAPVKQAEPAKPAEPATRATPVPAPRSSPAADPPPGGDQPAEPRKSARPAKRATKPARSGRPKAPASLTVTLAYESGEWTVAAHQGSKTLAKPYLVRPAEALKMVSMLDVPGVHDAVEQIVTAELTEAQRRAEALRSELAEVEARLTELRDAG